MSLNYQLLRKLLLALLDELEVLIEVVPLIVLRRLRRSRLDIIGSCNVKLLLRLGRCNVTSELVEASLIDRKTVRVLLARN